MGVPAHNDDDNRPENNSSSEPDNFDDTPQEIGWATPHLTRMTLPYRKVNTNQIIVRNGNQTMYVTAAGDGLPYGKYPRLLLLWLTEQVRKNYARYSDNDPRQLQIDLGSSLRSFMSEIGVTISGKSASQLIDQIRRLSHTTFLIEEHGRQRDGTNFHRQQSAMVSNRLEMYWTKQDTSAKQTTDSLLRSVIQLSPDFFSLLRDRDFPYDKRILKHVQSSPMAIDIYLWLTQHGYANRKFLSLNWEDVMAQFGTAYNGHEISPADRRNFRLKFDKALAKVREVYPEIRVISEPKKLTILPFNALVDPLEIEPENN